MRPYENKSEKKMKLLLFLLLLSSCSSFGKKHKDIDPEFKRYVQKFIDLSSGKVKKEDLEGLTIGFVDNDWSGTVGTCYPIFPNEIDVNRDWWFETTSELKRTELIFHELGHCILHRSHTEPTMSGGIIGSIERFLFKIGVYEQKGYLDDGCPASIMNNYILSEKCFYKHYTYYIDELYEEKTYSEWRESTTFSYNSCRKAKIINHTNEWNKRDRATFNRAFKTCLKRYKSCMKTFTKKDNSTYSVICN